jgi:hypothetical protein
VAARSRGSASTPLSTRSPVLRWLPDDQPVQDNAPSGRVTEYAYPRYFFSNQSADIRGLFCEYCEKLGIHWTQSNPRNISVAHRKSVALLDDFVGPKR